jgi:4-hydroxybenzoate polyprenyltransferase
MSKVIRQTHRWLAVLFTVTVIATVIALAREEPIVWVSYTPLLPLALLFLSGAWLFVRPYLTNRHR